MPVIGTAGHVDHGKSTLVQALTGRDPDRWTEEKERGLTIDLGFAWAVLPDGTDVSFVDVPGHEHFMKNMLAGIEAIDVALLVVAADEGWMPQSEEHLAVLDLLGVGLGVVAVTKTDRVDDELIELATLEVEEKLAGTSLEGSPVIPVSAVEGRGLDRLAAALGSLVGELETEPAGRPRMWIDRAFTISGAGTVVTGTLLGGSLSVGDKVTVWPGGADARVRSLQSHERDVETAAPRRRVAVNLVGPDRDEIERGSMLGIDDQWQPTDRVSAIVEHARYVETLADKGAYHVHIGSGAWPVRLRLIESDLALLDLPAPLPLQMGDRFILRETGRRLVMGGGRILDPAPPRRRRELTAAAEGLRPTLDGNRDDRATALLEARGVESRTTLAAHSGGGEPRGAISSPSGDTVFTPAHGAGLIERALEELSAFHETNPLRSGAPLATLASGLGVGPDTIESLAGSDDRLVVEGATIRRADFAPDHSEEHSKAWDAARRLLEESGPAVPKIAELGLDTELVHSLVRNGDLMKISEDFVFLPEQTRQFAQVIASLSDTFTVAEFRDRTGLSRKYAVPILEWADRTGLTVRSGDTRRPRR